MTNIELRAGESPTCHTVTLGPLSLVFSYETCVAFAVSGEGWTVSQNIWSMTTGKHINQATPFVRKDERVPNEVFAAKLAEVLARVNVADAA